MIAVPAAPAHRTTSALAKVLGFWSALLTAVCALGFLVGNLAFPPPAWRGMAAYIASFDTSQMLWMIPTLVLAPSFLVLMVYGRRAGSSVAGRIGRRNTPFAVSTISVTDGSRMTARLGEDRA